MSKRSRYSEPSPETRAEALKIAKGMQRPGQTKEQTKLIAQGIQKGIDQYKKQQRAKVREMDRRKKQSVGETVAVDAGESTANETARHGCRLPWALLVLSWIAFLAYVALLCTDAGVMLRGG